ncbi:hypothetical protein AYI68_g2228, partial [Smittium mucronatum]
MSTYAEVSLKHLLYNCAPANLKKICSGGSDRKIGCPWYQFNGAHKEANDSIALALLGEYYCIQEDHRAKVTYYLFHDYTG